MTNLLGGVGNDFSASPRMVSLAGEAGAILPGILGCLLFPLLSKRMPLRLLYLANGAVGGLFTLSLIALPHVPWTFALALLGEFLFQTISYTGTVALTFEAIGKNNPLAATTFTFLIAATNVPVAYMLYVDGRAYSFGGVRGSFAADAATQHRCMRAARLASFPPSGRGIWFWCSSHRPREQPVARRMSELFDCS